METKKEWYSPLTTSSNKVCFPSTIIECNGHWAVGTEWHYAKGTVTMYDEGFNCTCRKKPTKQCNHIINVKRMMYGTFDVPYKND